MKFIIRAIQVILGIEAMGATFAFATILGLGPLSGSAAGSLKALLEPAGIALGSILLIFLLQRYYEKHTGAAPTSAHNFTKKTVRFLRVAAVAGLAMAVALFIGIAIAIATQGG